MIIDRAAVSMVVAGMDGVVGYTNRAFSSGFRIVARVGGAVRIEDLFAPADGSVDDAISLLLTGTTENYTGEHLCVGADGAPVRVAIEMYVLRSESGEPSWLIAQLVNIEERKKSEEALAASESRWKFALEGARQGVWDHDALRKTTFHDQMWHEIRGLSQEDPIGTDRDSWLARIHPADQDRVRAYVDRQEQGVEGYDVLEYRERHRDGHYVWILSRGKPVAWDADGRAVRTIETDTDISHLKEVETQLAGEKERWRITLDAIADAIISTDAQGHISYMNGVACTLTGWSHEAAAGRRIGEVLEFADRDREEIDTHIATCLRTQSPHLVTDDPAIRSKSGHTHDVRCSISPITTRDDEASGVVLVIQDVTEGLRRRRQLELAATRDPLTGLANRAEFEHVAKVAEVTGQHHLLFLDLDRFKQINDVFGHVMGDRVLCGVGDALQSSVRQQDLCCRIGGDEFVVLLRDCPDENTAQEIVARIDAAVDGIAAVEGRDRVTVGVSIGMSQLGDHVSLESAMARADAACYLAKRKGRNVVADAPGP